MKKLFVVLMGTLLLAGCGDRTVVVNQTPAVKYESREAYCRSIGLYKEWDSNDCETFADAYDLDEGSSAYKKKKAEVDAKYKKQQAELAALKKANAAKDAKIAKQKAELKRQQEANRKKKEAAKKQQQKQSSTSYKSSSTSYKSSSSKKRK